MIEKNNDQDTVRKSNQQRLKENQTRLFGSHFCSIRWPQQRSKTNLLPWQLIEASRHLIKIHLCGFVYNLLASESTTAQREGEKAHVGVENKHSEKEGWCSFEGFQIFWMLGVFFFFFANCVRCLFQLVNLVGHYLLFDTSQIFALIAKLKVWYHIQCQVSSHFSFQSGCSDQETWFS